MELIIINIIYAIFPCKETLNIYIGGGARDFYIDEEHTASDKFGFAAFL